MKKIIWKIEPLGLPLVLRHCKKCGKTSEFSCSGQFRVNAQRKYLDIWLIYKCAKCDTTWNAALYSRVSSQTLSTGLLERFYSNDERLARQYAVDFQFLKGNGAEALLPSYAVSGDIPVSGEMSEVEIQSEYPFPVKVSALVRDKLCLSQKDYQQLVAEGKIRDSSGRDMRKCRLKKGTVLIFE